MTVLAPDSPLRALGSRCHSECRERQSLISCLLNCRPPDCAAKIASLSDEETLMVIFFHPENKHIRIFAAATFFRGGGGFCCVLLLLCTVPGAVLGALQTLLSC